MWTRAPTPTHGSSSFYVSITTPDAALCPASVVGAAVAAAGSSAAAAAAFQNYTFLQMRLSTPTPKRKSVYRGHVLFPSADAALPLVPQEPLSKYPLWCKSFGDLKRGASNRELTGAKGG